MDKVVDVITCTRHIRRQQSLKPKASAESSTEKEAPVKEEVREFWKLDVWEDDARRRRRYENRLFRPEAHVLTIHCNAGSCETRWAPRTPRRR